MRVVVAWMMLLASVQAQSPADPLGSDLRAWAEENGPILFGTHVTAPGLAEPDEAGAPVGAYFDLLHLAGLRTGIDYALVVYPSLPAAADALRRGEVALAGPFAAEYVLAEEAHASRPFLQVTGVIVTNTDHPDIVTARDLDGLRVGIRSGSNAEPHVRAHAPGAVLVEVVDLADSLQDLADGRLDALYGGDAVIGAAAQHRGISAEIRLVEAYADATPLVAFAAEDAAPLAVLDAGLATITPSETRVITTKWTGFDLSTPQPPVASLPPWLWPSVGAMALVAFVAGSGALVMQRLVRRRTDELRTVNATLEERVQEATAEVRANEQRYRALVHDVKDYAIFMLDAEGRVATWNEGAAAILGYDEKDAAGLPFDAFAPDQGSQAHAALLERARTHGSAADEGWRVRKDGTRFWADSVLTAMRTPDGRLVGYSTIVRDLTNKRALEQRLRDHAAALSRSLHEKVRSNQDLQAFAYATSHDLRQPVRSVRGFLDLLEKEMGHDLSATARHYVQRATEATDRMESLIDALLAYSRVATKEDPYEDVDLGVVMAHIREDLMFQARDSAARIEVGDLPRLRASARQMRMLFENLVSNAIKFCDPARPPHVRIHGRTQDGEAIIDVEDNGIGIPARFQERVFGMFERLHGRGHYEGHGMGLAIVKRIVDAHGGTITVRSEEGHGTVFSLRLPLDAP